MLSRLARTVIVLLCLAVAAQAFILWNATGRAGYTRYFDAAIPQSHAPGTDGAGLSDLFDDTGLHDDSGALEAAPNSFALGLAPSGGGRHLASVVTIAGPALLAAALTLALPLLTRRRAAPRERAGTP